MPQWQTVLDRFRPAGTPGAAGRPGIPADRSADAAAELTEVLALLDDAQEEAARTRQAAIDRAQQIRRTAHRQAAEIVAKARHDAERVRAQSEADALREAGADEDDMRRQAEAEIARLRERAGERLARDVDAVAGQARGWLDALTPPLTAESDR
ncbi:ATP synthase subunit B family protein [Mycobacterium sp. ML4]